MFGLATACINIAVSTSFEVLFCGRISLDLYIYLAALDSGHIKYPPRTSVTHPPPCQTCPNAMSTPRSKQEIAILKYEIKLFSDQLATYARLDDPLPPGVEMSMDEERDVYMQVRPRPHLIDRPFDSAFVVGVLSYAHR